MGNFETAAEFTLKHEGGLANDPNDPGGLTNGGITQRDNPEVDVTKLDRAGILKIYKAKYWVPVCGDALPLPLAIAVFDCAIHSGPRRSIFFVQDVLSVKRSGVMDVETKKAIAAFIAQNSALELTVRVITRRVNFLAGICRKQPKMLKFLKGWMNRTHDLILYVKTYA